jgi:hypothetical protein
MSKIVCIIVKKALLLDEIEEHQAVEEQRCIAFVCGGRRNALDAVEEVLALAFELLIKTSGNTLNINGSNHLASRPSQVV